LLGLAGRGLNTLSAALALICGIAFAVAAYLGTSDKAVRQEAANGHELSRKFRDDSEPESTKQTSTWTALMRYRRAWFSAIADCFRRSRSFMGSTAGAAPSR